MVPVWEQIQSFFFTVAIGLLMGIIVDGYRSYFRLVRPRPLTTILGDLLLWLFLTGLVFFLLLLNNWGEVRAYVLMGMAIGILIYRQWFSSFMLRFWLALLNMIRRAFRLLLIVFLVPLRVLQKLFFLPLGLISMFLDWVWRLMANVRRKIGIRPRKWLDPLRKWWHSRRH